MASTLVGSNALILEVLDRSNYKHWRSRLKTYLLVEDLWEAVEAIVEPPKIEDDQADYKAWTKKNVKALYAIQNSCGRELFSIISEIETAKSAWEALEQECKVVQGYDENNANHLMCYKSFIESVSSGDWGKARKCLGEVDIRSVVAVVVRASGTYGYIALHIAAWNGHVHVVKELLPFMTQEDLKTKTDFGHTALHLAAQKGHVHIVKELPVPLMGEVKDNDGDTALHIAVQEGQADVVKELVLLMRQEDLKINNDAGYTALHLAVNKGDVPMVKDLVAKEKGENNIGEDNFERYIPFTTWVTSGDWDQANECLRELDNPCGAVTAVDPRNYSRDTALHVASRKGHVDVTKGLVLLLKMRREDLELKSAEDFTTFGSDITLGVSEEFLIERANYMVEQYEKALGSYSEIQNARGSTALHLAVQEWYMDIVKELVALMRKEDLEIKDDDGDTALNIAILRGHVDIVRELVPLMRKEGLEIKDADGDTALNTAILQGHVDIAKELVQSMRQEGLEIKNKKGSNALHLAVKSEHMHIVKELMPLMRPKALEEKNGQGFTALNLAVLCFKDGDIHEIAKYMAEKNDKVFCIPSAPDDGIPVIIALRWSKWESARYIYSVTPLEVLKGPNGSSLICYCLCFSHTIDLAWDLLQRSPNLAFTTNNKGDYTPMLKLAHMHFAFLSGTRLTRWQRWLYDCISIREVAHVNIHDTSISVAESEDDHNNKKDFISSVMSFLRRFVKGIQIFCGIHHIYEMKSTHKWIFQFLHCMGEATKIDSLTPDQVCMVKKSIFKAIEIGHFEFVTQLCIANPQLLDTCDEEGRTIFHFAIENRQQEVYSLIYELEKDKRNDIGSNLADNDNSMLHFAANLSSLPQFNHIQDASLQMQRELQWFKEVESVVPPNMHEYRNSLDGLTARELFTKNHKKLIEEAENSTKRTATSCTVVGALIVTMMFAAAFTVPGGNDGNTGLPLLLDRKLFKAFIVTDTMSLVSSTTSVITFLGILTSRYAEDDFLKSLPTKMLIGLLTLFFSIVTMMIAFSCVLVIMLDGETWIVIPSILFTSVPAISFVWLLFPLLGKIFMATYGPGIFNKTRKVKS